MPARVGPLGVRFLAPDAFALPLSRASLTLVGARLAGIRQVFAFVCDALALVRELIARIGGPFPLDQGRLTPLETTLAVVELRCALVEIRLLEPLLRHESEHGAMLALAQGGAGH